MKIELNRPYLSDFKAETDLHAGGLFSCVLYKTCLVFSENGKVELTKKLVDAFRPMDDEDVRRIENFKVTGRHWVNERGYLACEFEEISLSFTGLPTEKDPTILVFYAYNRQALSSWSSVYKLA